MAAAVDSSTSFHRSHSAPDLFSSNPNPATAGASAASNHGQRRQIDAKNLPSLPAFDLDVPSLSFDTDTDFHTTLFGDSKGLDVQTKAEEVAAPVETKPRLLVPEQAKPRLIRRSTADRPHSWMPSSKSFLEVRDSLTGHGRSYKRDNGPGDAPYADGGEAKAAGRSRAESFASFARKSWISKSRSPSPNARNAALQNDQEKTASINTPKPAILPQNRPATAAEGDSSRSSDSSKSTSRAFSRASGYLTAKIKQRPQNVLVKGKLGTDSDSCASSATSLAPGEMSASASLSSSSLQPPSESTAPSDEASDMSARKRDPLWAAFRSLDAEFDSFRPKATGARMNAVRSTLMPFLRNYAHHSSNKNLFPEDVDRRATILNKWWNGLLEMLGASKHQPVAGVDRPTLLEATTMVMVRPEWRLSSSVLLPLVDRSPAEKVRARSRSQSSDGSLDSSHYAFITESADHNVRTMFVTNLITQMVLVVDKMSIRHAPLSVVNWAGRACAYAFFFAPGIADILVRLWGLSTDLIKRVGDEFGLPRRSGGESDDIVALFPPNMGKLGWTSAKDLSNSLRRDAKLPLLATKIMWHDTSWMSRWRGRDTDLFFVFCKYFYILAEGFMPAGLPLVEKARSPAFVLVHAQLLATLDSTIHRQTAMDMLGPPLTDASHGVDASLAAMPLTPTNLLRGMGENRMVVLMRDFFSDNGSSFASARHTFAESFMEVMKAATKRTSQFDHSACFTLCDFLEEAIAAYDSFNGSEDSNLDYVDWPFWFEVCKRIMESHNAMSEIRLLSFIFSIWDAVARDPARKEALCLEWLLREETFDKYFTNWCPMVRAYYMRLLCWRICRDSGSANEIDSKIFLLVSQRLKTLWSHYLWLKQSAEEQGRIPPATAPCYPTPGKRFMIIRTEIGIPQPGLFVGFDSMSSAFAKSDHTEFRGALAGNPDHVLSRKGDGGGTAYKKKWSLLGKVLSFSSGMQVVPEPSKPAWEEELESARKEIAVNRSRSSSTSSNSSGPPPPSKRNDLGSPSSDASSTGSSPIYDAQQYIFKFTLAWQAPNAMAPRERTLTRPRLPAPAQARIRAVCGGRDGSPSPPPAGLPPPTRRFSGLASGGLVDEARNASPLESERPAARRRTSSSFSRNSLTLTMSNRSRGSSERVSVSEEKHPRVSEERRCDDVLSYQQSPAFIIEPVKPTGVWVPGSKYSGRALAEWAVVVGECNGFVDRRRDEGVLGLRDVEVPTLGMEGFRKLA